MDDDDYIPQEPLQDCFSIVIVGDENVGKTSILTKYCHNNFSEEKKAQNTIDIYTKSITINNRTYKLKLWDTQFNESCFKLNKQIYERADCLILAYSVNDKDSFANLNKWYRILADNMDLSEKQMMIVGNKIDLEDERVVSVNDIKRKGEDMEMECFEVSCLTGEGMDKAFECLVKKAIKNTCEEKENGSFELHFQKKVSTNCTG
jgi:small GTP-binding protein